MNRDISDWRITFADTGVNANIGQRLMAARKYLAGEDTFLANYADGLTDMQELIRFGVLAPSFVVSYSHTDDDIDHTLEAVDHAAEVYARALEDGVDSFLVGRPVKPVFRAFN